jgi:regulator of RNase E activity RraB
MDDNIVLLILAVLLASLAIILLRLRRRKEPGPAFADIVVNQRKAEPPRIESHRAHPQRSRDRVVERERKQFDLPKVAQPLMEQSQQPQQQRMVQPVQQIIEQSAMTQPVINQPVMPQPVINNQPVMSQPVSSQPMAAQPAINQPVISQPAINQPAINQPVISQPAINQPVMTQPVINTPVMTQPIIEQPVVAQPNLSQQQVPQPRQEPQKGEPPKVEMPKTEPQKVEETLPEADQKVLDQLREAGSDLSKPHDLEFFLLFSTSEAASKAAETIKAGGAGFSAEVKRSPQGDIWMCYVTRKMVPEGPKIVLIGERFKALAQELGGEYDGWETSLVQ